MVEYFSNTNEIEKTWSFLYIILIPGLNILFEVDFPFFVAHKVTEVCRVIVLGVLGAGTPLGSVPVMLGEYVSIPEGVMFN